MLEPMRRREQSAAYLMADIFDRHRPAAFEILTGGEMKWHDR